MSTTDSLIDQTLCPGLSKAELSAFGAIGAAIGSIGVGLLVDHVDVIALFNVQAACYAACGIATYVAVTRPRRQATCR
jgi:predicted MFS family arabinose efflux permease